MEEISDACDKACAILKKTNDGDLLDPSDLKLTELAVNGFLNGTGREVFEKLYQSVVIDGNYVKPYLHGIEHLTRDHEGYIYYKGINIEHYDGDYVYSEAAKNELLELKRRCEFLEREGTPVSSGNAIWGWGKYAGEYGAERLAALAALLGAHGLRYSQVEIYNSGRDYKYFAVGTPESLEEIRRHPVTKSMIGRYFDDEYEITVGNFVYGDKNNLITTGAIKDRAAMEGLLMSCHDYLMKRGEVNEMPSVKYKTDFAEGYEKTKLLDGLLDSPGRSLRYSEVFMYGYGSEQARLYIIGAPTLDEVKAYPEYKTMTDLYGDRLTVSATAYQYGNGKPLTPDEMPHIAAVADALRETHDYLQKHDLAKETGWRDFTRGVEVGGAPDRAGQEREDDQGYEP
jgi:hypothetical protein